ncbi:hypothetical protein HPB50_009761 [Hyalomma asiaticum]|uniref:Uncharacterized protein n=1 Tax=Hyalomma asiaticum TaxID=266040 RepID=A0ACB7RY77_HYAAI|nr:hypothetical protein HPB50_009761 [Hyalomma asiaticum]
MPLNHGTPKGTAALGINRSAKSDRNERRSSTGRRCRSASPHPGDKAFPFGHDARRPKGFREQGARKGGPPRTEASAAVPVCRRRRRGSAGATQNESLDAQNGVAADKTTPLRQRQPQSCSSERAARKCSGTSDGSLTKKKEEERGRENSFRTRAPTLKV